MLFTLNRDKTICTTSGHAIAFAKDVPTHVPPALWAEVQTIGALPAAALPEETVPESREPRDPGARLAAIEAAFAELVRANKREDFSGTGLPHVKALERVMGFKIDNKERDALWQAFRTQDTER